FGSFVRDDVDDAVDGVGAPQRAGRTTDHLDAVDILGKHIQRVPRNAGVQRRIHAASVDQHQQLVREILRLLVAAEATRRNDVVAWGELHHVHVGREPQHFRQRLRAGSHDLVVGDDVDRRRCVAQRLRMLGHGGDDDLAEVLQRELAQILQRPLRERRAAAQGQREQPRARLWPAGAHGARNDAFAGPFRSHRRLPLQTRTRRGDGSGAGHYRHGPGRLLGGNAAPHTCKRSPSRATSRYSAGIRKMPMARREIMPATITSANGRCESVPTPCAIAAGSSPNAATSAVIRIGLRRSTAASCAASSLSMPASRNSFAHDMYTTPVSTDTPNSTMKPMPDDTENGVPVTHIANTAPTGADSNTPTTVISGNLKLP